MVVRVSYVECGCERIELSWDQWPYSLLARCLPCAADDANARMTCIPSVMSGVWRALRGLRAREKRETGDADLGVDWDSGMLQFSPRVE